MRQWLAKPRRPNGYAVIASILLVAGAVVVSLRWASIDHRGGALQAPAMDELAERFAQHHERALQADASVALPMSTMEQAAYQLSQALHIERLRIFDLSATSLVFFGAEVIEDGPLPVVGHVLYAGDDGGAMSLFMVPNRGMMAVAPTLPARGSTDIWIRWERDGNDPNPPRAVLGSDESLIYILISHDITSLQAAAGRIVSVVSRR